MTVFAALICRAMAIADRILSEWCTVTVIDWPEGYVDECGPTYAVSVEMTACGEEFCEIMEDVMHSGMAVAAQIHGALLSMMVD